MRFTIVDELSLDPGRSIHTKAIAQIATTPGRAWSSPRNGPIVSVSSLVGHWLEENVDVIAVEGDSLVRRATFNVAAQACAYDVGPDGRIAIARQDAADEPGVPVDIAIGAIDGQWTEVRILLDGGLLRALRWADDGRLLILSENEQSEVLLIDPLTGAALARANVGVATCDDGWLPGTSAGHLFVHGHCGCQDNELELLRFDGERLEPPGWRIRAPEGLCPLGVIDGEVVTIENDPRPVARRRDLHTGKLIAERDVSAAVGLLAVPPFIRLGDHVGFAIVDSVGKSRSLAALAPRSLEVIAQGDLPGQFTAIAFVDSTRVVVAEKGKVALLSIAL